MPAVVPNTSSSSESEHATKMITYRQLPYGDIAIQPTPTSTTIPGTGGHHVESVVLAAACGIIASGLFILVVFLLLRRRTQHAVGRSQKHMTWMQRSNEWGGHLPIQVELKTASLTRSKSELTTNTTQERSSLDEKECYVVHPPSPPLNAFIHPERHNSGTPPFVQSSRF